MSQSFHISVSISGVLMLSPKEFHRQYHGVFSDDDGRVLSDAEARKVLKDELEKGHELIPGAGCDNFDYVHGCRGHEHPDNEVTA